MSQPFTSVPDVMAELEALHQLHAAHETEHTVAGAAALETYPNAPEPTGSEPEAGASTSPTERIT